MDAEASPPKGMCLQHSWDLTFNFSPLSAEHRISGFLMLLQQNKRREEEKEKKTAREALTHLLLLDKCKFMPLSAFESLLSP